MPLFSQLGRAAFRSLRVLDLPAIAAQLRFAELRRRYYAQLWLRVAERQGARCEKWGENFTKLTRDGMSVIVRMSELRLDDHLTLDMMGDKLLTHRLVAEQGFEVPRHARFNLFNLKPAFDLIAESGRPIVVKPIGGTGGGNGVTTGVLDKMGLMRAAFLASRFDTDLLAEEQRDGHCYRLLYLDGTLIDAIRRDPPAVTGDGHASIATLVKAENEKRLKTLPYSAMSPLRLDRDALNFLAYQNLSPRSKPVAGETVIVKRAVNQNNASQNHVVLADVHAATKAACARLVTNLGVRLAGVDIIARDIGQPLSHGNGVIGEINTTPGLHHHDLVASRADGRMIASEIVSHLFTTRSGVILHSRPVAISAKVPA
jgi:D-alanine-D-alanine ligase-like ATP-grasp enzyme